MSDLGSASFPNGIGLVAICDQSGRLAGPVAPVVGARLSFPRPEPEDAAQSGGGSTRPPFREKNPLA